jgi:hypothetical protein
MKRFSSTNLYDSSRCTIYILIISSYDKIKSKFVNKTYISLVVYETKRDMYKIRA